MKTNPREVPSLFDGNTVHSARSSPAWATVGERHSVLAVLALLWAGLLHPAITGAAENPPHPPGELQARPVVGREDVLQVSLPPESGQGKHLLSVPRASEAVFCETRLDPPGRPVDFNLISEKRQLQFFLDASAAHQPRLIFVHLAAKVRQDSDGRIFFPTADQSPPANTGKDHLVCRWKYTPSRWGRYRVGLIAGNFSRTTVTSQLEIAGNLLTAKVPPSDPETRLTFCDAGTIALPTTAPYSLEWRCDFPGTAIPSVPNSSPSANGRAASLGWHPVALILEPACEGTPPVQAGSKPIVLHGRDATVRGTILRYEPHIKKQTLGYWVRGTDAAEWTFTLKHPGEFEVEVLQGCGRGEGGSEISVQFDTAELSFRVEETGHFQNFRERRIGRVKLHGENPHRVRVVPRKIAHHAALDLRQLRLVPILPTSQPQP